MINPIKEVLRQQKDMKMKGNLYHVSQVKFAYNSNHIEGSKLSEEQTELIFQTNTVMLDNQNESINVDDVIETRNHFILFDYLIDHADDPLTTDLIKEYHRILKVNTADSQKKWFMVGDWKRLPNVVGDMETTAPDKVDIEINKLLENYNKLEEVSFEDIVDFHVKFEKIHPFQDGNGRVGRAIIFKECLKNNIVPFIVLDEQKAFYYRGLKEYSKEKGFLMETCRHFQDYYNDIYERLVGNYLDEFLEIPSDEQEIN
ncbi:Fic family protein [Breznakia pachnodae]|uniref:Fic family protein n=1 Tax=Breznakia pachnodae TaxID=265178 RepID=A0ABU0E3U1_9FIRM|nr:Fic family protein [Breznakia pachnodae]MDQ0361557.1 Fic family protein [Breznakia pachnodae]